MSSMSVSLTPYSDIGSRRQNEDSLCMMIGEHTVLLMVADGLGGCGDGKTASEMTIKTLQDKLLHEHEVSTEALEAAIEEANQKILELNQGGKRMKTTIAALWIGKEKAIASHVGDSRIYQFRNGGILYQTVDHSASQIAAMVGEISPDEIRGHQDRSILIRAIGAAPNVKIDTDELDVMPRDAFLLCSDGFWELIYEREMLAELENADNAKTWMERMREILLRRYGKDTDNNTAVAAMIQSSGGD